MEDCAGHWLNPIDSGATDEGRSWFRQMTGRFSLVQIATRFFLIQHLGQETEDFRDTAQGSWHKKNSSKDRARTSALQSYEEGPTHEGNSRKRRLRSPLRCCNYRAYAHEVPRSPSALIGRHDRIHCVYSSPLRTAERFHSGFEAKPPGELLE